MWPGRVHGPQQGRQARPRRSGGRGAWEGLHSSPSAAQPSQSWPIHRPRRGAHPPPPPTPFAFAFASQVVLDLESSILTSDVKEEFLAEEVRVNLLEDVDRTVWDHTYTGCAACCVLCALGPRVLCART